MINRSSMLYIGRSIKLSSPRLNNMVAVGCGLVYGAVILLGLDDATLPDSNDYYPAVCTVSIIISIMRDINVLDDAIYIKICANSACIIYADDAR